MFKIIGNRLLKEEVIETPKQSVVIKSDIEFVENPNGETLELDVLPDKPQATENHFVVMILENGVLAYELRERPKPVEEKVIELESRTQATEDALLIMMMEGMM